MPDLNQRVRAATREYIENSALASVVTALITGDRVEDTDVFRPRLIARDPGLPDLRSWLLDQLEREEQSSEKRQLQEALGLIDSFLRPPRVLVTFCGPSCVGKDVVASELRDLLATEGMAISFLEKYTTRTQRGDQDSDGRLLEPSSTYAYFKSAAEFEANTDRFFDYRLYGHRYAFSRKHLVEAGGTLGCILGPIERIAEFGTAVLRASRRQVISILLNGDEGDLLRRLYRRHSLGKAEQAARTAVLLRQCDYIKANRQKVAEQFDLVLENSNRVALYDTVRTVLKHVRAEIETASGSRPRRFS